MTALASSSSHQLRASSVLTPAPFISELPRAKISEQIWDMKYRLKNIDGTPIDLTEEDTNKRIADALSVGESEEFRAELMEALGARMILPAGRIIAAAGVDRNVTMFNCFVMGDIPDDMAGIFEHLKQAALTMQQGGGIGYDFSSIRPKGAPVKGVGADASGPLSFMDVWDAMCKTIMSAGSRRGAMMAVMRCDHPDIEAFIDAKREPGRLRMFNLSVLVTDAFMQAVKDDADWRLVFDGIVFKTLPARQLWDKIMRATYAYAEPGVIFIDRINRLNNLWFIENIHATNPCFAAGAQVPYRIPGQDIPHVGLIEQLVGHKVEVFTGTRWQETEFQVTGTEQSVWKVRLDNGAIWRVTAGHRFIRSNGEKVTTLDLQPGDALKMAHDDAQPLHVATVIQDGIADRVFCCTVAGEHSFTVMADGEEVVVGNCGEQPLPPYGVCLLGSINLAKLVRNAFDIGGQAVFDVNLLTQVVRIAVRMLDNVIDASRFPLPEHEHEAKSKRRIGLGVTGLADALIMVGLRYGSREAVAATEQWMEAVRNAAYRASVDLAKEKGAFPLLLERGAKAKYLAGENIKALPSDIRKDIKKHGIRNALLTSIAPTGTISLFADNVSSGLEPVFSFAYTRQVLQPDGVRKPEEVRDYACALFRHLKGEDAPLPAAFVDAQSLTPHEHVVMQAAAQKYIDSAISKTINVPETISFEDFRDVYEEAYASGCKGCTTYRPNDITGSVLSTAPAKNDDEVFKAANLPANLRGMPTLIRGSSDGVERLVLRDDGDYTITKVTEGEIVLPGESTCTAGNGKCALIAAKSDRPEPRPEALPGATYKLNWPASEHAMYVTVNDTVDEQGRRRPHEVFINSKNMEHFAWTVGLTRMISAVFRRGGDVGFVVEELQAVFDPRGGQWVRGRYVPSLLAAIGDVIERHMIEIGFLGKKDSVSVSAMAEPQEEDAEDVVLGGEEAATAPSPEKFCPKCNQPTLQFQSGCPTCTSCGYSKCG